MPIEELSLVRGHWSLAQDKGQGTKDPGEAREPLWWSPVWDTMPLDDSPQPYPPPLGKRYLLPCHLLSHGGVYEYVLIDVPQARRWLLAGPCASWLSHPFLHQAFENLMGFYTPPPQRGPLPQLGYHDDALCFILDGYETLPDLKRGDSRQVKQLLEESRYTLGLLRRLS